MNPILETTELGTIEAFSRFRYAVLGRVSEALSAATGDVSADELREMSRLLLTSMEELKVAEEELVSQNERLAARQATSDIRIRHYRELFFQLATPALVTDAVGTIQESNLAAGTLFKRQPDLLEGKPLAALISTGHRDEFRKQFAGFSPDDGVRDWRLWINRVGDVSAEVQATVTRVSGIGSSGSGLLCWLFFNPASTSGAFVEP